MPRTPGEGRATSTPTTPSLPPPCGCCEAAATTCFLSKGLPRRRAWPRPRSTGATATRPTWPRRPSPPWSRWTSSPDRRTIHGAISWLTWRSSRPRSRTWASTWWARCWRTRARPSARRPEARSFRFEGNDLAYEVFGQGDHLLVYLHGLLLDADVNRGIAEALARQGNRVVLLDLLGHGRSDHPEHASAYRIDLYARQVFALLDHLGADQAVLGGVSLGANVSLQAAVLAPERVRGLVVEMPALEWAVPAAAVLFVPLVLALHYARPVATVLSGLVRHLPRTPFAPMNSMLNAASLPPEQMAAVLHGILVGPTAP